MRTNRLHRRVIAWLFESSPRSLTAAVVATVLALGVAAGPAFQARAQQPASNASTEARKLAHLLIKNALISVNQGNLTGNYTVLRDLASPGFRERNSASDLGSIFANLRQQKIDLSPIVLIDPVITQSKFSKEQNQLRLAGYFPSEPVQVKFDLVYQRANPGGWMIHGVSIGTESAEANSRNETEETANRTPSAPPEQSPKIRQVNATSPAPASGPPASRVVPAASGIRSSQPVRRLAE
jgi:hypothetical protein